MSTTPDSSRPIPASAQPLANLLSSHYAPSSVPALLETKILLKPLPLLPTSTGTSNADARSARRALRASKKKIPPSKRPQPLSAREKRAIGVHRIDRKDAIANKWDTYQVLRDLWVQYAQELVALGGGAPAMAGRLAAGDLHGAEVRVVRCRCVDRVGIEGTVVKETKSCLEVVRKQGGVRKLPKEGTVFRVEVPLRVKDSDTSGRKDGEENGEEGKDKGKNKAEGEGMGDAKKDEVKPPHKKMVFEIHGSMFMFRSAERAGRKFKNKPMPYL